MINFSLCLRCFLFLHLVFIAKAIIRKLFRRLFHTDKFLQIRTLKDVVLLIFDLIFTQLVNCGGPDSLLSEEFFEWRVWFGCQPILYFWIFVGITISMAFIEMDIHVAAPTVVEKTKKTNQLS